MDSSSSWPLALADASERAQGFTPVDWALLIVLLATLLVAAISAMSETALTSTSRIKLRNQAEEGDARAQRVIRLLERPEQFLSTILLVSNVAVIVATTVATTLAIDVFGSGAGEIISSLGLSILVLIFCENTPKTIAVQNPERWSLRLARPVEAAIVVFRPFVIALNAITAAILRGFGVQPRPHGPFVTEEELRMLVEVGEEEGVLEEDEREMIHNVFELADTVVREVMVPRVDMVTVEADATIDAAMRIIVEGGQSRIPAYDDSRDEIVGVLYAKDLLRVLAARQAPTSVRPLLRAAYFVPESKRCDDLLRELQQRRVHMAIVLDEYGSVAGLVTIEDLVEEIIGDIQDEYDKEEVLIQRSTENEAVVNAKISLDEFNEAFDTNLTSEDYETLGGFLYAQLDKIPTIGDTVRYDGFTFTVLNTKGRRVTLVQVERHGADDAQGRAPEAGGTDARGEGQAQTAEAPAFVVQPASDRSDSAASGARLSSPVASPDGIADVTGQSAGALDVGSAPAEQARPPLTDAAPAAESPPPPSASLPRATPLAEQPPRQSRIRPAPSRRARGHSAPQPRRRA